MEYYLIAFLILTLLFFMIRNLGISCFILFSLFLLNFFFFIWLEYFFLAFIFLIVYVGAIAILFVFVILSINLSSILKDNSFFNYFNVFSLVIFSLVFFFFTYMDFISFDYFSEDLFVTNQTFQLLFIKLGKFEDIECLGIFFYTYGSLLFFLCGVLLFVSVIGIVLFFQDRLMGVLNVNFKKQIIGEQLNKLYKNDRLRRL